MENCTHTSCTSCDECTQLKNEINLLEEKISFLTKSLLKKESSSKYKSLCKKCGEWTSVKIRRECQHCICDTCGSIL